MQKAHEEKINVIAVFAGFDDNGKFPKRITPIRFKLPSGEVHRIRRIRRSYTDKVGQSYHIHFVIVTTENRYFDILYDSLTMYWYLVVELEEELFFNN